MTPQEQAPAATLEEDFQRACEEAALSVLCEHRHEAFIEEQERKEERA